MHHGHAPIRQFGFLLESAPGYISGRIAVQSGDLTDQVAASFCSNVSAFGFYIPMPFPTMILEMADAMRNPFQNPIGGTWNWPIAMPSFLRRFSEHRSLHSAIPALRRD